MNEVLTCGCAAVPHAHKMLGTSHQEAEQVRGLANALRCEGAALRAAVEGAIHEQLERVRQRRAGMRAAQAPVHGRRAIGTQIVQHQRGHERRDRLGIEHPKRGEALDAPERARHGWIVHDADRAARGCHVGADHVPRAPRPVPRARGSQSARGG